MPKIHRTYTREVFNHLKYRPTWLPGTPIEIGTVGALEDGIFRPMTSLKTLGIRFTIRLDKAADGTLDFASETGVSVALKAAGELNPKFTAVAQGEAGALIEFSRAGAVVFQLRDVAFNRLEDQPELARAMLRLVTLGESSNSWERDWVVITEVVEAGSATIAIASSADSKLELKASGTVAPASLVDASARFSVAAESQVSTKVIAQSGLTVLYRALRVKKKFWWLWDEVLPASAEGPAPEDIFADADPAEDPD